jgi:hypothetical protein
MNPAYCNQSDREELFADADAQYAEMKEALTSEAHLGMVEAEVERWLRVEQHELMRRLIQSHVTLRGQERVVEPVIGADGVERTHVREDQSRQLGTVFGTVEVPRTAHSGRGISGLYPVDGQMNLPAGKHSHEVKRQAAKFVARQSFDATVETLAEQTGAKVAKRQTEELARQAAMDFDAFYKASIFEPGLETSELLVLTFDQKGVVLHHQDLSEATRKAAASSTHKLDTRGSAGEVKRGRKRMAMVAAVYTVASHMRTPQQIIAGLRRVRDVTPRKRPRPEYKRVWASIVSEPMAVVAAAFEEAALRDPEGKKRWLVVVDGDRKLARWARAEARRRGVQVTLVLDFIHALEYLWKAGHAFFTKGSAELETWVLERLERMLQGKISNVVAGMTRMATVRGLDAKTRKPVDKAAKYLLKRKGMMRYDELLSMGAPIASGIIEGACRHLINDRLDLTGACWRLPGAEAVLRLRSLLSSGDFDEYWEFHEQQEAERNHLSLYADGRVPETKLPGGKPKLKLLPGGRGCVD